MKKACSIFLLINLQICILCAQQQPATSVYGQYIWTQPVLMVHCDGKGVNIANSSDQLSIPKQKFKLLKLVDNDKNAVIQILDYPFRSVNFLKYNFNGDEKEFLAGTLSIEEGKLGQYQAYFKISLSEVSQFAVKDGILPFAPAVGVINYPFKLRPQKGLGDFSGSFNFGAALGITWRHRSWRRITHTFITGYSISNIVMDSVSVSQNSSKLSSTNNYTAFSFSVGYFLEFDKIQMGVFLGWDKISRINQLFYGWKYQGKPWISVGFGYSIFSPSKSSEPSDTKQ